MKTEEIRKNREAIRSKIKAEFNTSSNKFFGDIQNKNAQLFESKEVSNAISKFKRRASADRTLQGSCYLKQIRIFETFQSLFKLGKKLGEGAQSTVYTCKQLATQNIYAVKIIKNRDQQLTKSLIEQFKILKSINHPNVIKGHYLFINQNQCKIHIVCQYFSYPTLRQYMMKKKIFKEIEIAQIISSLLGTLSDLHELGICHRDIKPENILYNPALREMKLIDFEIAKMAKYGHQRVSMMTSTGTLAYKAPQMFGGEYNEMIDIWAVGIIAYQMAFKTLPFWSQYNIEVIRQIQQDDPVFNQAQATILLIQFIQGLLRKNPLKRINAKQALKNPFLLKHSSLSTTSSSNFKVNGSQEDKQERLRRKMQFQPQFIFGTIKYYDQDCKFNGQPFLYSDIGIRVCSQQGQDQ